MDDSKRKSAKKEGGLKSILIRLYTKNKSMLLLVSQILLLVLLFDTFGAYGLLGFVVIWSIYGSYKLYLGREFFIVYRNSIESFLFGKPLNKCLWNKGELKTLKKRRKLKFVWGKNETKDKRRS